MIETTSEPTITDLIASVNALTAQQAEIAAMLTQVVEQIAPTLDAIKASPIGKILGV